MNSLERYQAVLAGEASDILPRVPILMAFAVRFIGSTYARFASDYRVLVEANLRCAEHFDFDQVSAISDPFRETSGFGAEVEFPEHSVPRCVKPPLEDDLDFTRLAHPDPFASPRMWDRVQAIKEYARTVRGHRSILGWVEGPAAEAADLRGVTNFLMDLATDPDYACALMDHCVETAVEFAEAQIEAGADTIGMGDAIASQISPAMYAEYVVPREKRIIQAIHAAGGRVRLHICGNTTHLLPHFRALNCDIVDLDWQVDLAEARRALGPRQPVVANLDPVRMVMEADPDSIRSALLALYETVENPFIAGSGCEIPPDTPEENLKALCAPIPWRANP